MYSAAIRTCCNIFLFAELVACIIYLVSGPFCGSYILISLERIYIYVVRKFEEALCISFLHCRCLVSTRVCPLGCWIQAWNKRTENAAMEPADPVKVENISFLFRNGNFSDMA